MIAAVPRVEKRFNSAMRIRILAVCVAFRHLHRVILTKLTGTAIVAFKIQLNITKITEIFLILPAGIDPWQLGQPVVEPEGEDEEPCFAGSYSA
jgi:hypothetical protein